MKRMFIICSLIFLTAIGELYAQEQALVRIDNIYPKDLVWSGFKITKEQDIHIQMAGLHQEGGRYKYILGTAWILNADTREVVWSFKSSGVRRGRVRIQEQEESVRLTPGTYEVYFSSFPAYSHFPWQDLQSGSPGGFFGNFFNWLFEGDHHWGTRHHDRDLYRKFMIVIKGDGENLGMDQLTEFRKQSRKKHLSVYWETGMNPTSIRVLK